MRPPPMDPQRWARLEALLDEVLELDPTARALRLRAVRDDDPALADDLQRLLAADQRGGQTVEDVVARAAASALEPPAGVVGAPGPPGRVVALPGARLGAWRLVKRIGLGGMGAVWLAERADGQFEQRVAVKLLDRVDPGGELIRRFEQERRILAPLQHPNVARLLDGGVTADGLPWFAMELVEGLPLTEWCAQQGASEHQKLDLFDAVCRAVAHAHHHLIVHRDLKPSNILVGADGQVKLVDFGIAKLLQEAEGGADPTLTRTGVRMMTPRYAAPEQIRGEQITTATDVHALGVVLYELLVGQPPFGGAGVTERETEQQVLELDPPPLPPSLRGDLRTIVTTALRKEPALRYATADALAEDLSRWRRHLPIQARPATARYLARRFVRRHRAGVITATLLALALVAGLATTLWQARAARLQAQRAQQVSDFVTGLFDASSQRWVDRQLTARQLVDDGAQRLRTQLRDQPRVRADLLLLVGDLYGKLGQYAVAESVLTEAVAEAERGYGPQAPALAQTLNVLGVFQNEQGRLDQAEASFRRALQIAQSRRGHDDGQRSAALANIASVLGKRGDHEQQLALHQQVIELDRRRLGSDNLEMGIDLDNLGMTLSDMERYAEADSVFAIAQEMRTRLLGPTHPEIATTLSNRATAVRALGRAAEAESMLAASLAIRRAAFPEGHPDVAGTLVSLGMLYREQGRLAEAESSLTEAVAMHRRLSARPTFELGRALNALAVLAYSRGEYPRAVEWMSEALEVSRTTSGPEAVGTLTMQNNLGVLLHRMGNLDDARRQLNQVYAVRQRVLDPGSKDLAASRKALGMLAIDRGDWLAAQGYLEAAVQSLSPLAEGEPSLTAEARLGLGLCRLHAGRLPEAEPLLVAADSTLERAFPAGHQLVRRARAALRELYTRAGKPAQSARFRDDGP